MIKLNKEQQKVIDEINQLLHQSFEDNELLLTRDKTFHVSIAVLDLLRLVVKNNVIQGSGDKFADIIYKIAGHEILNRTINNDKYKLDKIHEDVIYDGGKND